METPDPLECRKMGLFPATLMVAGNMMGSGVFMLPANLASYGSICIIGWHISTAGAIMLALVFAKLASLDPAAGGQMPTRARRSATISATRPILSTAWRTL